MEILERARTLRLRSLRPSCTMLLEKINAMLTLLTCRAHLDPFPYHVMTLVGCHFAGQAHETATAISASLQHLAFVKCASPRPSSEALQPVTMKRCALPSSQKDPCRPCCSVTF